MRLPISSELSHLGLHRIGHLTPCYEALIVCKKIFKTRVNSFFFLKISYWRANAKIGIDRCMDEESIRWKL